jgi:glyoxylase-like metal-dependent hydrolase (beta-lactamase superfamily II)
LDLPLADRWFSVADAGNGVTRLEESWVDPFLVSNVWHVRGRDRDVLIDAANGIGSLADVVGGLSGGRPVVAVATHAHFDHVGGLAEFADRRCHESDAGMPTPGPLRLLRKDFPDWLVVDFAYYDANLPDLVALRGVPEAGFDVEAWSTPVVTPTSFVSDGEVIDLGDRAFEVLHTPGHTAGSICLWEALSGTLFSGDAIYVDDRLGWEDPTAFASSLRRLRELAPEVVHGGHGRSFDGQELKRTVERTLRELEA